MHEGSLHKWLRHISRRLIVLQLAFVAPSRPRLLSRVVEELGLLSLLPSLTKADLHARGSVWVWTGCLPLCKLWKEKFSKLSDDKAGGRLERTRPSICRRCNIIVEVWFCCLGRMSLCKPWKEKCSRQSDDKAGARLERTGQFKLGMHI